METLTIVYIILSGIIALFIALFQYRKHKNQKLRTVYVALRAITVFAVLLLLVNPKFENFKYTLEKPQLVIAVDNSNSIKHLNKSSQTENLLNKLKSDQSLRDKFDLSFYTFESDLKSLDSLTFDGRETNIDKSLQQIADVYKSKTAPTILITDGNQTFGNDYQFATNYFKQPIYPVILGDTITYTDLKIQQLNVNKYAYLKNRFPVELILVYNGNNKISSKVEVKKGRSLVYSEDVNFSKTNNSKVLNFTLPANTKGINTYNVNLVPQTNEKNKVNNEKNFAVEVIDQKTKIAIVTDVIHPDIGALKKSIETNEQRAVFIFTSNNILNQIDDFQLVIFNHPNSNFKGCFDKVKELNKNTFTIVGTQTDLSFLNSNTSNFSHEILQQTEEYQADFNLNYAPFQIDNIDFESFPPLNSNYGSVEFNMAFQNILTKRVGSVSTEEPLLTTFENGGRREAVLFGENIWKWRAQSYLNSKSFNDFDDFMGKIVQYLSSSKRRSRLNVEFESFYIGNHNILINAQVFDKNYVFDNRESLTIVVTDTKTNSKTEFPFVLKNNNYQVDLSSLQASDYSFTVKAKNANISKSGVFTILEYNVEEQFLNANVTKLQQLATNSKANSYFIDNTNGVVNDLINDERYVSIQKSKKNIIPLIDWKILLAVIALSLSAEWFLRKYNGLI